MNKKEENVIFKEYKKRMITELVTCFALLSWDTKIGQ